LGADIESVFEQLLHGRAPLDDFTGSDFVSRRSPKVREYAPVGVRPVSQNGAGKPKGVCWVNT